LFFRSRNAGDTLDFTPVADKLPSTQNVQGFAESQNGNGSYYITVQGTATCSSASTARKAALVV